MLCAPSVHMLKDCDEHGVENSWSCRYPGPQSLRSSIVASLCHGGRQARTANGTGAWKSSRTAEEWHGLSRDVSAAVSTLSMSHLQDDLHIHLRLRLRGQGGVGLQGSKHRLLLECPANTR